MTLIELTNAVKVLVDKVNKLESTWHGASAIPSCDKCYAALTVTPATQVAGGITTRGFIAGCGCLCPDSHFRSLEKTAKQAWLDCKHGN